MGMEYLYTSQRIIKIRRSFVKVSTELTLSTRAFKVTIFDYVIQDFGLSVNVYQTSLL